MYFRKYNFRNMEKTYETGEELMQAFEEYVVWAVKNPIRKPELLKSGLNAGETVYIDMPRPQSLVGFCIFIGIGRTTWYDWRRTNAYPHILPRIEDRIFQQQVDGAQVDLYNQSIVARRLGMTDKKEIATPDLRGYSILE